MKIIECKNISKTYPNQSVGVENVSLSIEEGEFVYLIGASGSGKSTLLKMLYREEKASTGKLTVCGYHLSKMKNRNLFQLRREIGVIFQNYQLLTTKTVYENIAFALEIVGIDVDEADAKIRQTLTMVEMADKMNCYPHELSGGQQQRVAIARALINDPKLIIADEPTGNLDPRTSMEIFRLLKRINQRGATVLLATHDQHIVENFRFRTLTMKNGRLISDEQKKERNTIQYDYAKKDFYIV